jgi:hypothetical protein
MENLEHLLELVEAEVSAIREEAAVDHMDRVREHALQLDSVAARITLLVTRW